MAKFAVIQDDIVNNIIIAESKEIAEQVTGKTCIEYDTEQVDIGNLYIDGAFIKKEPLNIQNESN